MTWEIPIDTIFILEITYCEYSLVNISINTNDVEREYFLATISIISDAL